MEALLFRREEDGPVEAYAISITKRGHFRPILQHVLQLNKTKDETAALAVGRPLRPLDGSFEYSERTKEVETFLQEFNPTERVGVKPFAINIEEAKFAATALAKSSSRHDRKISVTLGGYINAEYPLTHSMHNLPQTAHAYEGLAVREVPVSLGATALAK